MVIGESANPPIDQRVTDWAQRVVNNGGAQPTIRTQQALNTFMGTLTTTKLFYKMFFVNCVVPDNLTASFTPLIRNVGFDAWVNHNFTGSDLTVNGLKGDGVGRYLDTGAIPAANGTLTNDGLTLYIHANANDATDVDFAASNGSNQILGLYNFSNAVFWDCHATTSGSGRMSVTNTGFTGYMSGNRGTLGNGLITAVFTGSSAAGHGILVASTTNVGGAGVPNNVNLSAFAFNASGVNSNFSQKRISFFAHHQGLSITDSFNFFNAIQTLRINLGGGFV